MLHNIQKALFMHVCKHHSAFPLSQSAFHKSCGFGGLKDFKSVVLGASVSRTGGIADLIDQHIRTCPVCAKDLLLAEESDLIADIMETNIISAADRSISSRWSFSLPLRRSPV